MGGTVWVRQPFAQTAGTTDRQIEIGRKNEGNCLVAASANLLVKRMQNGACARGVTGAHAPCGMEGWEIVGEGSREAGIIGAGRGISPRWLEMNEQTYFEYGISPCTTRAPAAY